MGDPGGVIIWLFLSSLWDSPQRLPPPGSPFWTWSSRFPRPGSCLGLGLLLSQDSPTSTCCFGPGVGVGVGPSLFPFLRLPQSDVTLLVCACHQGPHLHDRRATEAKNKVWGRLGLRPTVCRGGRDELWGRGTCLCPGPTSKPCIPSLALPLLGNGRVPGRGLLFPRRQMAGARGRDVFDPFFVLPQFGSGRIRQSVSQGLSLDKRTPGVPNTETIVST